ncbi:MAG: hypothetical protein J0J06_15235 [Sphingomonas sp.]|uniref:hypothetical protein n=1 Tax=Sphingomonas sp. TaxID=28214 RepID=UPI001AD1D05B|nr:hypothetical protein [Sphingomonas sp.]MBN8816786.1 hypothetical protein [Sphingomonas sp.]
MRAPLPLTCFLLLAACGSHNDDAGSVSPEEDRLLNEAASSLDVNSAAAPDTGADANTTDSGNAQ